MRSRVLYCPAAESTGLLTLARAAGREVALLVLGGEDLAQTHRSLAASAFCRTRQRLGLPLPFVVLSGGSPVRVSQLTWMTHLEQEQMGRSVLSEAECMAYRLTQLGLSADRMLLDTEARDTAGNMLNSARMLTALGAAYVILVTDSFHVERSKWLYRQVNGHLPAATLATGYQGTATLRLREKIAWARQAFSLQLCSRTSRPCS